MKFIFRWTRIDYIKNMLEWRFVNIGSDILSTTYKVLETDAEFLTAALLQTKVSVWYRQVPDPVGELMDHGGVVEGYSATTIRISDSWFYRERFEFRAHTN